MLRLLLLGWDRFSLYLPIVLMSLLSLGTYWLVQSTPVPNGPAPEKVPRHEPDYFMKNFSVRTFQESGRLKSEVFGAAARHFPDTDTLEIDAVRIRSFDAQGRLTTSTASRAVTDGDGSEVQLFGKALVVREAIADKSGKVTPQMEFRGEYLRADLNNERLSSDRPVEIRRGADVFHADSLNYDNVQLVLALRGRVKGTLNPAATR